MPTNQSLSQEKINACRYIRPNFTITTTQGQNIYSINPITWNGKKKQKANLEIHTSEMFAHANKNRLVKEASQHFVTL
jgi:hypothetical protein